MFGGVNQKACMQGKRRKNRYTPKSPPGVCEGPLRTALVCRFGFPKVCLFLLRSAIHFPIPFVSQCNSQLYHDTFGKLLQSGVVGTLPNFKQFPRVTSIGSLPPKTLGKSRGPLQNPAETPRNPRRDPAEPSERPPQSPLRGKFPRRASQRVVPLGW